jgi:hypothetical protein
MPPENYPYSPQDVKGHYELGLKCGKIIIDDIRKEVNGVPLGIVLKVKTNCLSSTEEYNWVRGPVSDFLREMLLPSLDWHEPLYSDIENALSGLLGQKFYDEEKKLIRDETAIEILNLLSKYEGEGKPPHEVSIEFISGKLGVKAFEVEKRLLSLTSYRFVKTDGNLMIHIPLVNVEKKLPMKERII